MQHFTQNTARNSHRRGDWWRVGRSRESRDVALDNIQRFISLDLRYAHAPDMDRGVHRAERAWLMGREPRGRSVMRNHYHGRNDTLLLPSGDSCTGADVFGCYPITEQ